MDLASPVMEKECREVNLGDYLNNLGITREEDLQLPFIPRPEILLGKNIPKPMHGVAPRVVLGSKWWDKERKDAYASTDYHCLACGVHKSLAKSRQWLEAHELYEIDYEKGRMTYIECTPLCHLCHQFIHDGRLTNLLRKSEISHAKFVSIIQHGDSVLRKASLRRQPYEIREQLLRNTRCAPWEDWRMVVGGFEYPPLYRTEEEWMTKFEG